MSGAVAAGQVGITKLDLHLHSKEIIQLAASMVHCQLFEDMFSHCIHGSITIADGFDLLVNGPIVGGEMIDIEFQTSAIEEDADVVRYKGIVYKVGSHIDTEHESAVYTIRFTSPEMIVSETKKISRYFSGPVTELVKDIYRNDAYLGTQKALAIEEPEQNIQFTTPYWSPFKVIEWLARSSLRAGSRSPDFVDFETLNRGFQFISVGKVIEESDPIALFSHSKLTKSYVDINDLNLQHVLIENMYVDNVFDLLARTQSGVYASRLMLANTITKSISIYNTDIHESYKNMPTLNPHVPIPSSATVTKNAHMISQINQEWAFPGQKSLRFEDWVLQRTARLQSLHNIFKVDIEVAGRFDIGAGRKVKILLEQSRPVVSGEDNENPYLSGDYLVTAVCHTIYPSGRHQMSMQCVTESLSKALP